MRVEIIRGSVTAHNHRLSALLFGGHVSHFFNRVRRSFHFGVDLVKFLRALPPPVSRARAYVTRGVGPHAGGF